MIIKNSGITKLLIHLYTLCIISLHPSFAACQISQDFWLIYWCDCVEGVDIPRGSDLDADGAGGARRSASTAHRWSWLVSSSDPDLSRNILSDPDPDLSRNILSDPDPDLSRNILSDPDPDLSRNILSDPDPTFHLENEKTLQLYNIFFKKNF